MIIYWIESAIKERLTKGDKTLKTHQWSVYTKGLQIRLLISISYSPVNLCDFRLCLILRDEG